MNYLITLSTVFNLFPDNNYSLVQVISELGMTCSASAKCLCYYLCKSRKRRLEWAMKSPVKGKAVWADIVLAK